jgi:hypothetical protein
MRPKPIIPICIAILRPADDTRASGAMHDKAFVTLKLKRLTLRVLFDVEHLQ